MAQCNNSLELTIHPPCLENSSPCGNSVEISFPLFFFVCWISVTCRLAHRTESLFSVEKPSPHAHHIVPSYFHFGPTPPNPHFLLWHPTQLLYVETYVSYWAPYCTHFYWVVQFHYLHIPLLSLAIHVPTL